MSESHRTILVDGFFGGSTGTEEGRDFTTEEEGEESPDEFASLLDALAADDPFQDIEDPVEWQRTLRREQGF